MGFVESASNGKLLLKSDTVRASFNLTQANFTYGPVQTWPKWPSPPIVEVIAVQAQLENGDWLASQKAFDPNLFHRAPCQNSPEVAWGVANQLASIVSPSRAGGRRARRPLFWRQRSRVWDGDGLILGVGGRMLFGTERI